MNRIFERFDNMPQKRKMILVTAVTLTFALFVTVPSFAWFYSQRKAAEMFKVKYPNSLYINAAHREDRKFFELDEIDVDEEVNNTRVLSKKYVFSISGEGTNKYTLQMAHTNNNGFEYKIYNATEIASSSGADAEHKMHATALDPDGEIDPEENKPENTLTFSDEISGDYAYYRMGSLITGTYLNGSATAANTSPSDTYYKKTYGSNTNVQAESVPVYWQQEITTTIDPNTKQFCDYYILEVSWTASHRNTKETDMLYLSVKRK